VIDLQGMKNTLQNDVDSGCQCAIFWLWNNRGTLRTQQTTTNLTNQGDPHMRTVLAAAILAIPSILPAQAVHTGISHLVASVDAPAFAFQASAVNAAAPRVFSGLIAPIRLNALTLGSSVVANEGKITVEYTVDAAGVPQNIKVVDADAATAERVAAAVRNIRYTPGKLNGVAVAVPVTLHIDLLN
jgi:hypothetical protein